MSLKKNGLPYSFSRNAPFDGTSISSKAISIYLKTGQVKIFQGVQIGGHVEEEFIQHQERMLQCLEYVYGTCTKYLRELNVFELLCLYLVPAVGAMRMCDASKHNVAAVLISQFT